MVSSGTSSRPQIEEDPALDASDEIGVALQRALKALETAESQRDPLSLGVALIRVARIRYRLCQYETSEKLAQEVLSLNSLPGALYADAWHILANCSSSTGHYSQTEAAYRHEADLAREIGYHRAHIAALHGLAGGVYIPCGEFDLALQADEEALEIASKHNRQDLFLFPLVTIAIASQVTGRRTRAEETLDRLDSLILPGSVAHGYSLCLRGNLAFLDGDRETAQALYQ